MDSRLPELIRAADLKEIKALLRKGLDVNAQDKLGHSALMIAALEGSLESVHLLLENGADPDLRNKHGESAFDLAIQKGKKLIANLLAPVTFEPMEAKHVADDAFSTLFGATGGGSLEKLIKGRTKNKVRIKKALDRYSSIIGTEPQDANFQALTPEGAKPQFNQAEASTDQYPHQKEESQEDSKFEEIDLDSLVGQEPAKSALRQIIAVAKVSSVRESKGLPPLSVNFHAVFQGNPGTGKTTFARFYAQEIKKLGLLEKGQLIEVSRADLVAEYQGQTATKTLEAVKKAIGGILFIDEAYSLKNSKEDSFGQECIDTLVKAIEDFRDELIVILAGYTNEMREFLNFNTGLKSRIPNVIDFEDFTPDELLVIFDKMREKQKMSIEPEAKSLVREQIALARKGRSFGNAREVRNIFERALAQQSTRLSQSDVESLGIEELSQLVYSDLTADPKDRGKFADIHGTQTGRKGAMDQLMELHGLQAVKNEISQLSNYIRVTKARRGNDANQDLTVHMVFSGNPGTGKTTVARLMGKIFKEIGLLGSGHLVEVDRAGLVAEYQGQTATKTKEVIESAIGGVLFVDEAYTLYRGGISQDAYGQEAIDTLLKSMEDRRGQFVVILAGYLREMETFMQSNTGLRSRFSKVLHFQDFIDEEIRAIALDLAKAQGFEMDLPAMDKLLEAIGKEKEADTFSNARSVRLILEQAYKKHASRMLNLGDPKSLDADVLNTLVAEDFDF